MTQPMLTRTASAVQARVDAFLAGRSRQRQFRYSWVCPVCDHERFMVPTSAVMCRICEREFEAIMASETVRRARACVSASR